MSISQLFGQALLSEASYADFWDDSKNQLIDDIPGVQATLRAIGFSVIQSEEFTRRWRIIDHQPNTSNGFSATVFEALDEFGNGTGELSLAIRGSEGLFDFTSQSDWLSNLGDVGPDGIAIHQAIDLFNYYQRLTSTGGDVIQYTYHGEKAGVPASISSEMVSTSTFRTTEFGALAGQQFSVTGHSLGGHLALVMERLASAMVTAVTTFNAVGFDTDLKLKVDPLTSEGFFDLLRDGSGAPISSGWNESDITRIEVQGDIVSEIGNLPATQQLVFSEGENEGPIDAHNIDSISDSFAVYELLNSLDSSLTVAQITPLLEAGSNEISKSLEAIINSLGGLLSVAPR